MKILIAGGGIGGLTTAIALQKKGYDVTVFEQATKIKPLGAGLGMAGNAVRAYDRLGLKDLLLKNSRLFTKANIVNEKGKEITSSTFPVEGIINSESIAIHRADLHSLLLGKLKPGTVVLGKAVENISQKEMVTIQFTDGTTATGDCLIAADGIHSAIRKKLLPEVAPRYAGYTCWRSVITDAPASIPDHEMFEFWGKKGRFGIVPLTNKRIYWFACINAKPQDATFKNFKVKDLQEHFKDFHPYVSAVLGKTENDRLLLNDIIDIKPITKFAFGKIVLTGDAAHATTPNLGQGACQAIEDAVILADCIEAAVDIETAFKAFEKKRIKRTTGIVNTSWQLGKIAQWQNPVGVKVRNSLFRMIPDSFNKKQLKELVEVDF